MNKIFLTLAATAALASAARAQSEALALTARAFDAQTAEVVQPFILEDSFAGLPECRVLDIKTIRAWSVGEATELSAPCFAAVGRRISSQVTIHAGFLGAASKDGAASTPALFIKTDLVPGSKAHRDLVTSLNRRDNRILGLPARLLTRDEAQPAAVSLLQQTLKSCIMPAVVRDLDNGDDFVKIYGRCLQRDAELRISALRGGKGLTVTVLTERAPAAVESLNGFVTVNAGRGPVQVMVVAYSSQTALP